MDICTNSDHSAVVAKVRLNHLLSNYSLAELKIKKVTRTIFLYEEATKEDWDKYRGKLDRALRETKQIKKLFEKKDY